ncbi:MAG: bifunctional adenosylcobinamide kinase/adenosylcobinamide-phosphate guanylyltransferase [Oscillospiraceae bacterium]|nr:bifunctional adenosylcobinamide kinase/adenosylcobinamide-phosphate guanylyltransferase [Oscillospiraceae bacterium]
MILVVGAHASGKLEYVKAAYGYTDADIADAVLDGRPVVCNVQAMAAADPANAPALLPALLEKQVVVCDEVGSGVIPAGRAEREGREAAGRLCVLLAQRAEHVVRIVCGLPAVLK